MAVSLANRPELVATVLGGLAAGVTVAPLDPLLKAEERADILADLRPALVVETGADGTVIERAAADGIRGEAAALVLYTSGSTGRPKGAVLSHAALTFANRSWGGPVIGAARRRRGAGRTAPLSCLRPQRRAAGPAALRCHRASGGALRARRRGRRDRAREGERVAGGGDDVPPPARGAWLHRRFPLAPGRVGGGALSVGPGPGLARAYRGPHRPWLRQHGALPSALLPGRRPHRPRRVRGAAGAGREDPRGGRRGTRAARRRRGRATDPYPGRDGRVPRQLRRHRGGAGRRLVPDRRHRAAHRRMAT